MKEIKIVAELAQGFEGKPEQAKLLMKAAASAGADAAKYQMVYADELASPDYKYYDLFKSLEMEDDVWSDLSRYASELGIELQLDIFGTKSLETAARIGVKTVKLHGTDIANLNILNEVAKSEIPNLLLGAGGAHLNELERAIEILKNKNVTILLGFQAYPTPDSENQISRVRFMCDKLRNHENISIGFADHADPESTLSYALSAVALGMGASVIEKHLTLGKCMKLEDHEAALNPDEFQKFCVTLRACSEAIGEIHSEDDFGMYESEKSYRTMIRRHVVAGTNIKAGDTGSPDNLILKRTSEDNPLTDLSLVYNRKFTSDVIFNSAVTLSNIE